MADRTQHGECDHGILPSSAGKRSFQFPGSRRLYAGLDLDTAKAEIAFHRTAELAEIGVFEARMQMRLYLADFDCALHDVRTEARLHDPDSYTASQAYARELLAGSANGVIYRSVRRPGGECIACFRPRLVLNVRQDAHFEYRWEGTPRPAIRKL